jgi:hypothetical protein
MREVKFKEPNISCSHSFVDPRLKMIMEMIMMIIIIMGHECKRGTIWSRELMEKGEESILRGKEDQSVLHTLTHIHMDSMMKYKSLFEKRGRRNRNILEE